VFGFVFENAVQDGDSDSIYNITSGNSGTALATCTTSNTTNTCSTPVTFVLTGNPYELETFASSENNYTSGTADSAYNYTIVVLPPVPAQPSMYSQYSNNVSTGSLILTTSQWSAEYGSNMTGCLLHYGQTPYQPSNVPQLLTSSTPATSLPAASVTYFSVNQNASMTVSPASFSNAPVSMVGYDYHFICYNGNGASPEVILYNITVNSGKFSNSATSSYSTSNIVSLMIGVLGVACSAILFGNDRSVFTLCLSN